MKILVNLDIYLVVLDPLLLLRVYFMSRRFFLEGYKFGLYLIVPISLAVCTAIPGVREKIFRDFLRLPYPNEKERDQEQLEKLRQITRKD